MSSIADRLRELHSHAISNRVTDYTVLLEAADHIDRLERQAKESEAWLRDNFPEMYGTKG